MSVSIEERFRVIAAAVLLLLLSLSLSVSQGCYICATRLSDPTALQDV